jgi:hypothetical protein
MATWPSANKPVTTTTDAASDSISGARADINKAITNQIEIIDMFNIPGSPTDNYILKYNASANRFDMEEDSGGVITGVTTGANNRMAVFSGATTLRGEATITHNGTTLSVTGSIDVLGSDAGVTITSGAIDMNSQRILEVADPTDAQDAATKAYVDANAGGTITGVTNFVDNRVVTASGATTLNGEANLTFDGSTLTVTGALAVDNLKLDGNTLSSTDTNGNITLDPAGNGSVIIGPMSGSGGIQLNDNISNATTNVLRFQDPSEFYSTTATGVFGVDIHNEANDGAGLAIQLGTDTGTVTAGTMIKTETALSGTKRTLFEQDYLGVNTSYTAKTAFGGHNLILDTRADSSTQGYNMPQLRYATPDNKQIDVAVGYASGVLSHYMTFDPTQQTNAYQSGDNAGDFALVHGLTDSTDATGDVVSTKIWGANSKHSYTVNKSGSQSYAKGDMEFAVAKMTVDATSNMVVDGSAGGLTSPVLELVTDNTGYNRPALMFKDSNADYVSVGGENNTGSSLYVYNFTMDPNNTHGRTGVTTFAGDYFVGFTKNYSDQSAITMDMNVYGANGGFNLSAFDDFNSGGGGRYNAKPIRLKGSQVELYADNTGSPFGSFTKIVTVDHDSVDITQDVVITDTKQLKFGTTTTIDKNEITTSGDFTVNVDSDNSGNEAFVVQSAGTDVLSFSRGPGGDAEMTITGDGLFFKGDDNKTNLSMDLSSATQTGINVIRSNENKTLSFTLKTDDDDDTGNYDGSWSFRQNADEKALILERTDGATNVDIFEIRDSADVATANPTDVFQFKIPPVVPSYAVGSLPTTVIAGAQALATGCNSSDVSTGTAMAFFDGSNWKYSHLPATTVRT